MAAANICGLWISNLGVRMRLLLSLLESRGKPGLHIRCHVFPASKANEGHLVAGAVLLDCPFLAFNDQPNTFADKDLFDAERRGDRRGCHGIGSRIPSPA